MSNKIRAYAFASGHISFTNDAIPHGALILAHGPEEVVRSTVCGLARRAYDNETLLVPGCPEAENDSESYAAFSRFFERVQLQLGRHGIGTEPEKTFRTKRRASNA